MSEKKGKNIFKNPNIFANLSYKVKFILNSITIRGWGGAFFIWMFRVKGG